MRKRIVAAILAISFISLLGLCSQKVSAVEVAPNGVVISQVQVRDSLSASNEVVEIYNNGLSEVDITNWCIYYASKDYLTVGSDWRKLACFILETPGSEIVLATKSYARIISTVLRPSYSGSYQATFTATLSNDAGHVRLVDSLGNEIDRVGWGGLAVNPEGTPAVMGSSSVIERRYDIDNDVLIDTNNNGADFFDTSLDMCRNMMGLQDIVPLGYLSDTDYQCSSAPDLCSNLDGWQVVVPDGYTSDGAGGCVSLDVCPNITGVQLSLPEHYILDLSGDCIDTRQPLKITELLPNAIGDDAGQEFIEIYNPNDWAVNLADFRLVVGLNGEKTIAFPDGSVIEAKSYEVFTNADLAFSLLNSSSQVKLILADEQTVEDTADIYSNPQPGMSWSLIDSTWQYTDQATPGSDNLAKSAESFDDTTVVAVAEPALKPCAANQYRSPDTNRCRLIINGDSSVLTPCKTGQYRSEETNRCRSIVSDVANQVPCSEGEERNPATNRCRSVLGAATSAPAPCGEGEERNPATNRCRKIVTTIPKAAFAVQPIADTASSVIGWWAFGGVGLLALGYAGWEWRVEALGLIRRLATFIHLSK